MLRTRPLPGRMIMAVFRHRQKYHSEVPRKPRRESVWLVNKDDRFDSPGNRDLQRIPKPGFGGERKATITRGNDNFRFLFG